MQRDSFNVSGSPLLVMNLDDGDITISPSGNAGEIRITATINDPSKANYAASQDGDTVLVSTSHTGNININTGADVEVAVPERDPAGGENGRWRHHSHRESGARVPQRSGNLRRRYRGNAGEYSGGRAERPDEGRKSHHQPATDKHRPDR